MSGSKAKGDRSHRGGALIVEGNWEKVYAVKQKVGVRNGG